jgi:hypothetical protein
MESHKVVMGVGIAVFILGMLLMSSMTIYYSDYPSTLDWPRTLGGAAVKLVVLAAGWWIYKRGQLMRDGR